MNFSTLSQMSDEDSSSHCKRARSTHSGKIVGYDDLSIPLLCPVTADEKGKQHARFHNLFLFTTAPSKV
jgi:hypothetical protein